MVALVVVVLVALLACGLERQHRRRPYPRSRMSGGTHVEDRDTQRVVADLRAIAGVGG